MEKFGNCLPNFRLGDHSPIVKNSLTPPRANDAVSASCYTSIMLWTMLTLMGSSCLLLGSIEAARHPPMPLGGLIGAIFLGSIFAAFNFWAWNRIADSVIGPWVQRFPVKKQERLLAGLYAIVLLWALFALALSCAITHVLLGGFRR